MIYIYLNEYKSTNASCPVFTSVEFNIWIPGPIPREAFGVVKMCSLMRHGYYLYIYLYGFQFQNPFHFKCQSMKVIAFFPTSVELKSDMSVCVYVCLSGNWRLQNWFHLAEILHTCSLGKYLETFFSFLGIGDEFLAKTRLKLWGILVLHDNLKRTIESKYVDKFVPLKFNIRHLATTTLE